MIVPNKIYLQSEKDYYLSEKWTSEPCEGLENTEFIRKDALIKWLKERINDGDEEGIMTNQIANLAYKDVIDKLNDFPALNE